MGAGVPQLAVYVRGISSSRNLVRGPRTPQPHHADRDRLRSGVLRGGRQVLFWYMRYCGRSQANGGSACSISARGGTVQAHVRYCGAAVCNCVLSAPDTGPFDHSVDPPRMHRGLWRLYCGSWMVGCQGSTQAAVARPRS